MLRTLSAALLATALIAGPAFAAEPTGTAGSTQPAATSSVNAGVTTKTVAHHAKRAKTVKRVRKHVRKHVARVKTHATKQARHVNATKTHQSRVIHTGKSNKKPV